MMYDFLFNRFLAQVEEAYPSASPQLVRFYAKSLAESWLRHLS